MSLRFGSVCSGIEAASVAWHPLGWKAAWFSEIEPFPCAVLAHHYPDVPNHGDMTTLPERILIGEVEAPDVFCGGTPCQAFSVAGNRRSLDDARGNLSLTFCEIADAIDNVRTARGDEPAIIFWENVPGVLNTKDNAFGCFLAGLAGEDVPLEPPGGKWTDAGCVLGPKRAVAWRVCDAQYFSLAQRRRRVFVVSSSREGFDPAKVLFEFYGVRRDSAPSREAGQGTAGNVAGGAGGVKWPAEVASTLNAAVGSKLGLEDQHINGGAPLFVPAICAEVSPTVTNGPPFSRTGNERVECDALVVSQHGEVAGTLTARHDSSPCADRGMNVIAVPSPPHAFKIRGGCEGGGKGYLGQDEQAFRILTGSDQQVAVPIFGTDCYNGTITGEVAATMGTPGSSVNASGPTVAVPINTQIATRHKAMGERTGLGIGEDGDPTFTLQAAHSHAVAPRYAVRRLTPTECERLQGFPDGYTNIPWRGKQEAPDGPRYKALGNSWAVPVVRWIGARMAAAIQPRVEDTTV